MTHVRTLRPRRSLQTPDASRYRRHGRTYDRAEGVASPTYVIDRGTVMRADVAQVQAASRDAYAKHCHAVRARHPLDVRDAELAVDAANAAAAGSAGMLVKVDPWAHRAWRDAGREYRRDERALSAAQAALRAVVAAGDDLPAVPSPRPAPRPWDPRSAYARFVSTAGRPSNVSALCTCTSPRRAKRRSVDS